ncbi:MAG: CBS domain-containing protein, partial [Saprospiraceae bacterium]|nr:CBS domain-containing protein [Saprospiraceae bacterium]
YNDDWMRERGFIEPELSVAQLVDKKKDKIFIGVQKNEKVKNTIKIMKEHDISQLPVLNNGEIVGSITENKLLEYLLENPSTHGTTSIELIMNEPFPTVSLELSLKDLNKYISKINPAVVTSDRSGNKVIITQYDIIQAL